MNRVTAIRNRKNESGQVLLLAVIAMILVLIATLLLFDVHTVIRGKVKAQNGVDAAAMTAAEWQKHSLNVIGDLNLARATCTLLSNPYFGVGVLDNPGLEYDDIFSLVREHNRGLPFVNVNQFTSFPRQLWDFLTDPNSPIPEEERKKMLLHELVRVEAEKQYLIVIDELISQLQTRLSFIGPMIAFGAAQQAAKNNGLRYDEKAGATYNMYRTILLERLDPVYKEAFDIRNYDADEYEDEDEEGQSSNTILPDEINGFYWPLSYIPMLDSIFALVEVQTNKGRQKQARGIAAGTSFTFSGMPKLIANSWTKMWYLGRSETYHNILTENWRAIEWLLRDSYPEGWWSTLRSEILEDFSAQSEILPLHIEFSHSENPYQSAVEVGAFDRFKGGHRLFAERFDDEDPVEYQFEIIETETPSPTNPFTRDKHKEIRVPEEGLHLSYNDEDADTRYNLLPLLSWALYDSEWQTYSDEKRRKWENDIFNRHFASGLDYQSGARAYFNTAQETGTLTSALAKPKKQNKSNPQSFFSRTQAPYQEYNRNIGEVFSDTAARRGATLVSDSLYDFYDEERGGREDTTPHVFWRETRVVPPIQTNALAKPLGVLKTKNGTLHPYEAGRMVLPVFEQTALIPISLEPVEGLSSEGFSSFDVSWLYFMKYFIPKLETSASIQEAWDEAVRKHPKLNTKECRDCCEALKKLDDPNFRQRGLDWLEEHPEKHQPGGTGDVYHDRSQGFEDLKLH